jgi:CHAT domain-containing protein
MPAEARMPALPSAGEEIADVRQEFASSAAVVRTGADAQPASFADSKPAQFSIIHFAAHATTNSDDPLDAAVILAPRDGEYKLYARDIIRVPLRADLVTVSACRSEGAAYAGEGLVGFAWAFIGAGARNVVAGLWEVDDQSSRAIMHTMYAEYHHGQTPQEALRRAKLQLIHSQGPQRKPYYWASFQVLTNSLGN